MTLLFWHRAICCKTAYFYGKKVICIFLYLSIFLYARKVRNLRFIILLICNGATEMHQGDVLFYLVLYKEPDCRLNLYWLVS